MPRTRKYAVKPKIEDPFTTGKPFPNKTDAITKEMLQQSVESTPDLFKHLADKVWTPFLEQIMLVEVNEALRNDDIGAKARERIYNRIFGKPVEQHRTDTNFNVSIKITPIESREQLKMLEAGNMLEGEFRELPAAQEILVPAPLVYDEHE